MSIPHVIICIAAIAVLLVLFSILLGIVAIAMGGAPQRLAQRIGIAITRDEQGNGRALIPIPVGRPVFLEVTVSETESKENRP